MNPCLSRNAHSNTSWCQGWTINFFLFKCCFIQTWNNEIVKSAQGIFHIQWSHDLRISKSNLSLNRLERQLTQSYSIWAWVSLIGNIYIFLGEECSRTTLSRHRCGRTGSAVWQGCTVSGNRICSRATTWVDCGLVGMYFLFYINFSFMCNKHPERACGTAGFRKLSSPSFMPPPAQVIVIIGLESFKNTFF